MNILQEFYYGRISPGEKRFDSDPEYKNLIEIIADSEKKLIDSLSGEEAQVFM